VDSGLEDDLSDLDDNHVEEDEGSEDFQASKAKPKTPRKPKAKIGGPPANKKPRKTKAAVPKGAKTTGRKPKKGKDGDDAFDAMKIAKETKITADNPLFSTCRTASIGRVILTILPDATMNPSAALQSTAEDFLDSLSQTPGPAQAELINCILRACGCNDSVDADEVMDYDGVVDTLDTFTESLKQV